MQKPASESEPKKMEMQEPASSSYPIAYSILDYARANRCGSFSLRSLSESQKASPPGCGGGFQDFRSSMPKSDVFTVESVAVPAEAILTSSYPFGPMRTRPPLFPKWEPKEGFNRAAWKEEMDREKESRPNYSPIELRICGEFLPKRKLESERRDLKDYLDQIRDTRGYGLTLKPPLDAFQVGEELPPPDVLYPVHPQPPFAKDMEARVVAKIQKITGRTYRCTKVLNFVRFVKRPLCLAKFALREQEEEEDDEIVVEAVFQNNALALLKIVNGETVFGE